MKRLMLATTAALTLSAPAFAQSQTQQVVENALATYGYEQVDVSMLSDAQIAELYIAVTSEDQNDIRQTIEGMEFARGVSAEMTDAVQMSAAAQTVEAELSVRGFPAGTVSMLTDAEVTELYLAVTGEDQNDVSQVIDGLQFGMADMVTPQINSSSDRFVAASLMSRGYGSEEIMSLTDAELTELFLALTSEDENGIRQAIDSALS